MRKLGASLINGKAPSSRMGLFARQLEHLKHRAPVGIGDDPDIFLVTTRGGGRFQESAMRAGKILAFVDVSDEQGMRIGKDTPGDILLPDSGRIGLERI